MEAGENLIGWRVAGVSGSDDDRREVTGRIVATHEAYFSTAEEIERYGLEPDPLDPHGAHLVAAHRELGTAIMLDDGGPGLLIRTDELLTAWADGAAFAIDVEGQHLTFTPPG